MKLKRYWGLSVNTSEIIKQLRNFRKKWRREITRERKFQQAMAAKYPLGCPSWEKSVGIDIGYSYCASDIDKLIKKLEHESKQTV